LVSNPLQIATRQDDLAAAIEGLAARFETVEKPYLMPTAMSDIAAGLPDTGGGLGSTLFTHLIPMYITEDGRSFRLEVILGQQPTSYESMDTVHDIREILKDYRSDGGDAVVSGGSAINTDVRETMDRDFYRAIGFVLLGIFLVLLLMLRSAVAPMYLIGTVLLSFTCTLGLTNMAFKLWLDVDGLTWYVPFFMFVFLVALGMDYSIFLFGRIKEEVGYHGVREGIHVAVARTGAIITSAGIILAGTFAAMITGEIKGLMEVGFAVSVGVLIDTFVVRTILDPALATLFGRWTWWPGGVPKAQKPQAAGAKTAPAAKSGD
jgi:RND superfamily putative drug exporter